jgi:hypothetical protein
VNSGPGRVMRPTWNLADRPVAPAPPVREHRNHGGRGSSLPRLRRSEHSSSMSGQGCDTNAATTAMLNRPLARLRYGAVLRPSAEQRRGTRPFAGVPHLALSVAETGTPERGSGRPRRARNSQGLPAVKRLGAVAARSRIGLVRVSLPSEQQRRADTPDSSQTGLD